jgi:hypothetical protein
LLPLAVLLVAFPLAFEPLPAHAGPVLLVPRSFPDALVDKYDAVTGAPINTPFVATLGNGFHTMVVDQNNHVYVGGDSGIIEYNVTTGATINSANIGNVSPGGLALDGNNHLFISNNNNNSVGVYNATTLAPINANLVNGQGLNAPRGVAVDNNNHLFVASYFGNTVGEYNATTGATINATFLNSQALDSPQVLLLDGLNHLLVGFNHANASVGQFDATTGATINAGFIVGPSGSTWGMALDGNNHLFVANNFGPIAEYNATTGATINATFISPINHPNGLAFAPSVPEPSSLLLAALAFAGVAAWGGRRRKQ